MTFGENIKRIRKEKGISQQDLGNKLGVTQQTIAQYEKIKETPKFETVRRIANALGIAVSELNPDWSKFNSKDIIRDWFGDETEKQADDAIKRIIVHYYETAGDTEKDTIKNILVDLKRLNETGQEEARKRVNELTEIKIYTEID